MVEANPPTATAAAQLVTTEQVPDTAPPEDLNLIPNLVSLLDHHRPRIEALELSTKEQELAGEYCAGQPVELYLQHQAYCEKAIKCERIINTLNIPHMRIQDVVAEFATDEGRLDIPAHTSTIFREQMDLLSATLDDEANDPRRSEAHSLSPDREHATANTTKVDRRKRVLFAVDRACSRMQELLRAS